VLDPGDAPERAFQRIDDMRLHRAGFRPRPGDHYVDHGDADLRFLLARGRHEGEHAGGEGRADEQRRQLAVDEGLGDPPGESKFHGRPSVTFAPS